MQKIDQLLRGANPAEMPVESPTEFTYVLNESTANALGLAIPGSVRIGAHEVIH
jgi:putative ABC transport system substrate-binding protein